MLGTYYYHHIIKKTVTAFGTLFNDIYIEHQDAQNNQISQIKVPIAYGPIQKFLARIEQQPNLNKPIEITLPRMSYEINSIQYDGTRKTPPTQTFKTTDGTNMKQVYMPVPYNIGFELNIFTKLQDDALQIIEQILPFFQPQFTVTINLLDNLEEKRDIPFVLNDVSFRDDYEGDFSTRRALIYTLQFTAKTYLFGAISPTSDGLIRKVQIDYYSDTSSSSKREMRYTVTPNPITAGPNDNYGFTEELDILSDAKKYSPTQQQDI